AESRLGPRSSLAPQQLVAVWRHPLQTANLLRGSTTKIFSFKATRSKLATFLALTVVVLMTAAKIKAVPGMGGPSRENCELVCGDEWPSCLGHANSQTYCIGVTKNASPAAGSKCFND